MATPTAAKSPGASVVGNAFVEQYYHILHKSPELVYRFYQDSSMIARPDANGAMTSVTTMKAINDLIISLDYQKYKAEIFSADAQESHKDGVMVLVTGCLTGKDNMQRKFAQSFFLAPQDVGYFVFNDVFRYVDENESLHTNSVALNRNVESVESNNVSPDRDLTHVSEHPVTKPVTSLVEESLDNNEEVHNPSDYEEGSVDDVEVIAEPAAHSGQNEALPITETASSLPHEDAIKKSYASILKVVKGTRTPIPVYVPANSAKVASGKTDQQSVRLAVAAPRPEAPPPSSNAAAEITDAHEEVEGHSIYIRSLGMNVTIEEVEEEFKKFGIVKPGGIQVRINKQQGYCFGFVEFEELSSMHSALEASPITIGGRQAFIEQKRTTSRGKGNVAGTGKNRVVGRGPPNREGIRTDNFRARGNFGGGRGFGRNNFGNRGEFSGRGRGALGRGVEGYQRVNQNVSGRTGRQGGVNQTNSS
ncbi:hypothetical protein IFM89_004615 [Coptis chinensis]|uniref:G3BP-like protein n=1 Tax=Coptis chinensis TaxID=261450 RepID=A0A835H2U7_9MAGN|nr:hypothetical protein IFM89_004615 [Coptis chinensis]